MSVEQSSPFHSALAPLQFFRRSESHMESACGRYLIQWCDSIAHGRWYSAWLISPSPAPRKHLYDGYSETAAKAHCNSHAMFNQPRHLAATAEGDSR